MIGDARARSVRAARSGGYLLGTLMTATVTLVGAPLPGRPGRPGEPGRPGQPGRAAEPRTRALRHDLAWLVTHVATGLPAGALALLCLGNLLLALAARAGVPTRIDIGGIGEPGEVPAAVEAITYSAVTEALANIARHSRATRAAVRVTAGAAGGAGRCRDVALSLQ
ncbi:hypothetical protein ACIGFK_37075 [Streptomyces sp. NPDC085524]|uniref:hypothetical protein n=1 Tax=Streptomyces sp. NPDC085524 TaxID=3365728 RepID=UPI0037D8D185